MVEKNGESTPKQLVNQVSPKVVIQASEKVRAHFKTPTFEPIEMLPTTGKPSLGGFFGPGVAQTRWTLGPGLVRLIFIRPTKGVGFFMAPVACGPKNMEPQTWLTLEGEQPFKKFSS